MPNGDRTIDRNQISEMIIAKLSRRNSLDAEDHLAIRGLSMDFRHHFASSYLVREGQPPSRCAFLVEGYAYRQKLTIDGHRTICSLEVPGDFVDLQNIYLRESDHDVLALTDVISVDIPVAEMRVLAETAPAVGRAMWVDGLIEGAIFREWLLNIGRRNARSRVAHILCEFSTRLQAAGLAPELTADLPMTQEQLGDALGLTSVHVNRILRTMEAEGLVTRGKRQITITDWQGIRRVATFNPRYLHLHQEQPGKVVKNR
ncbi:MAG: Crp/Fnr family transcriptional regulator [Sphingobium sp.]|nr:Crp/Fnr family transcriptional regulator [Sphingobium sp.]